MSFITRWYYDLLPSPIRRLHAAAEAAGATDPLRRTGNPYAMRLAVDDHGVERVLFEAEPDAIMDLRQLRARTVPATHFADASMTAPNSPWDQVGQAVTADMTDPADRLGHHGIPDVSRPITVNGVVYHRLALTDWAHRYPVTGSSRELVIALQDNEDIRNAIPLAQRLRRERGARYVVLTDDHTNYESVGYALVRSGMLPDLKLSLAVMVTDNIGPANPQLAITRLAPAAKAVALPSGAVLPNEVIEASNRNAPTFTAQDIAQRMHSYALNSDLGRLHLRELAGLTLMGRDSNSTSSFRLVKRADQAVPDLWDALDALPGDVSTQYDPRFPAEDWAFIDSLFMKNHVAELLTLPLRRVSRQKDELRTALDSAMESVARHSRAWNEAVAAEQSLSVGVSDERVQTVLDSIVRTGKIRSLSVRGDVITAHTSTIYVQDDRSGAWHRMGDFRITINTDTLSIKYENLTDAIQTLTFGTHPHIDSTGRACVGNFSTVTSQLVAANDWLGLVEMCVVFLSNANTRDSAGMNLHRWPFVEKPEEVGLPPYPATFQGPTPDSSRQRESAPAAGPDPRVVHDMDYEDGYDRRSYDDIHENPRHGDELLLYSERTDRDMTFTYDEDLGGWYDVDGYNEDGFNEYGYDSEGYDRDGWDADGYDHEGYDRSGYDEHGYDDEGFDNEGYDRHGLNRDGRTRDEEAAA